MTKECLSTLLNSFSCILDSKQKIEDIEKALRDNGLSLDNLVTVFTYNRDKEVELSLMTKPNKDIHLYYKK